MLDWDAAVGGAVVGVSVVEAVGRPESVVVLVEDIHRVEGVLGKLEVALEEFLLAGALFVRRSERADFAGVLPRVVDELADALLTVLVSHTLLAILERLALVVQLVLNAQF